MPPTTGAGQDDRPKDVEPRWDPNYSCTDFVPDHEGAYETLATAYDSIGSAGSAASAALANVIPASWTGGAAGACSSYVSGLTTYINSAVTALSDACTATKAAQRSISDAATAADTASTSANEAQANWKTLQANEKKQSGVESFFGAAGNWWHEYEITNDRDNAVKAGNHARDDALTANQTLAKALDGPDHALVSAKEPTIPNPVDQTDPDQAGLLATIMQPVSANLKKDGDTAAAQNAVAQYNQAMKDDPSGKKAKALLAQYGKDLSPAELNYLLDHLDENDLATTFGQIDPKKDRDLYNLLAGKADASILERLGDTDPNHYWHPATGGDNYIWGDPNNPNIGLPPGGLDNLHQGELGDCHDIALLGAITKSDPNFLANHVQKNANGTYTVTLYDKNGKPVDVTITPDMPSHSNADGSFGGPGYAHDGDWNSNATLFQIYEKALAQSNAEIGPNDKPGYTGMDGGNTNNDTPIITGQHSTNYSNGDISPSTVQDALNQHKPITVSTLGDNDAHGDLYDDNHVPHLIPGHEYYVDSIDPKTHAVTVVNPWGRDSKTDGTVTMTWDQYQHFLGETQVAG